MYDRATRRAALDLVGAGVPLKAISRQLGVSRAAIREWAADPTGALSAGLSSRCFVEADRPCGDPDAYGYLLGQYLGDGHLVTSARVPVLRIYACTDYPAIIDEIDAAIVAVRGTNPARLRNATSDRLCTVQSYWKHWTCLLPQHGPGLKHRRPIVLAGWQQEIVDAHPWSLIRGLIQSDGCRAINRVRVRGVRYEYPRYFFANESADILAIMGGALDRVGVAWRYNRPNSISIAKRAAVAALDEHVGPKQ